MMRKLLLTCFGFMLLCQSFAQSGLFITGGVNLSNSRPDSASVNRGQLAPTISTGFSFRISNRIFLKPELQYSQRGFKQVVRNVGNNINFAREVKQVIHYLELPLTAAIAIPAGKNQLLIAGGPVLGWALGGRQTTTTVLVTNRTSTERTLEFGNDVNQIQPLDIGGRIELSYLLKSNLILKADYNHGLRNLSNRAGSEFFNQSFGLGIGYLFSL